MIVPFVFPIRVYYEDTDAGGIVYYANYLKFLERARTELLRSAGIEQSALAKESGIMFVVRRCLIDFLKPAMLDDHLTIETRLADIHRVSMDMHQAVSRGPELLVKAEVTIAIVGANARPTRLPVPVREAIMKVFENG